MSDEQITIKCINPATKELLDQVPCLGKQAVELAVSSAWTAFENWKLTDYPSRAKKIRQLKKIILKQSPEIARLITLEVGKPLVESTMSELTPALAACDWFAQSTEQSLKDQIINLHNPILSSKQSLVVFEPLGVIGIISPWNYPFAIPMMSIIMALMTGNTVVLKPSEKSSLVGIKIGELFEQAGFPKGTISVITGDGSTGEHLTNSKLAKLIFTGSVAVGSQVMSQAAKNVLPVTLELGGKDPAIVLPDAPPQWTAKGLVWGAFTNCGQACASIERVYLVKDNNNDKLLDAVIKETKALHLGSGLEPTSDIGPMIDEMQLQKVQAHVEDAISKGAKVLCGGRRRNDLNGYFWEPTLLTNVNHHMQIMTEETFGPVLPIMIVDSEDQAIELANQSQYGLCASIWTSDLDKAEDIAENLEVGTVLINDSLFSFACPQVPWGGIKKSGFGRSHSYFGLLDLVNIKHVSIDSAGGWHRQWWYPYGQSRVNAAQGGLHFLHGTSLWDKFLGLLRFAKSTITKS